MKKIILASAALAALSATPAFAQAAADTTSTQTQQITVTAINPAKCSLAATSSSVALDNDKLTDANGFVRSDISSSVADKLNTAGVTAWCTGNNNTFIISRTAFTTGGGGSDNGFQKGILYDVGVKNPSSNGVGNENTEDGPAAGLVFGRFGATGNSTLTFAPFSTTPVATSALSTANGADSSFTTFANTRVIAGNYTSTVTLTIQPGV